ncbi:MAG: hypothetical protein Q8L84_08490 [Hyphomonas sp.]|nr:hypothetical protein [Hyphomonas sp.]
MTKVELAYRALHALLSEMALASDACPDEVFRNRTVAMLLSDSRTGVTASLNLLDEKGRFLAEEVTGPGEDGRFEIVQPAMLEVIVIEASDEERDARFDAIMGALAAFFCDLDDDLGGLVDDISVTDPPDRFILQAVEGAKAARVRIDMTMTLPTVFG